MGNTRDTGYLRNLVIYDGSGNITLPANLTVTGTITGYATTSYVTTQISNLINGAPGALDTLNELAAALGNDASFAATLTTSLSGKQASLSGTGFVKSTAGTISYDTSTYLTTASATSTYLPLAGGILTGALLLRYDGGTSVDSVIRLRGTNATARTTRLQFEDYNGTLADGIIDFKIATAGVASSATLSIGVNSAGLTFNNTNVATFSSTIITPSFIQGTCSNSTNGDAFRAYASASGASGSQPGIGYYTSAGSKRFINQLDVTSDTWGVVGTTGTYYLTITQAGVATFSNTLYIGSTIYANTGNEYLRNTAGAVYNAQFQTWFNSAGTRRGYFGYGSGGSNTLELNNESGGDVIFGGGSITANGEYFKMKGAGGSAEFIWYKNYSGSPSEPGFVVNNRAGATTFSHNANGGGTSISGTFSASNFSGSSSGTNTGDQSYVTSAGKIFGYQRGSFTVGGNTSTFYPVAFQIGSSSTGEQGISVLQIERGGYDEPGYSNYTFSTFHCRIRAKADGWGYGASYVQVEANAYTQPMLAEVAQQNQTSQLIVWLRGGCAYRWMDIEGSWTLNFGNPSGTSYSTFSGNAVYASTTTNSIGSNFKYQQGWGDNYISGKLTAATATFNLNASSIITLVSAGTDASMIKAGSGDELYIGGNDTWRMRFSSGNILMDNGGRVGIGTSSPDQALHVTDTGSDTVMKLGGGGAARDTNFSMYSQSAANTVTAIHYNGAMGFYNGKFNIASSGSATLTGSLTQNSSDSRLKENIIPISNALSKIEQLTGFTYTWNQLANRLTGFNTSIQEVGLSAQSVQSVLPEAVFPAPFDNEFDPSTQSYKSKSGQNYLTIQYEKLVPLLVEAIKELTTKVNALENK